MSDILNTSSRFASPRVLFGERVRSFPLPGDRSHFVLREKLVGCRSAYFPLRSGTPHPSFPGAILVGEGPEREEGDAIWFRRSYATVPSSHSEYSTIAYTFPGYFAADETLRTSMTLQVVAREQLDFFHSDDPSGLVSADAKIPVLQAWRPRDLSANELEFVADAGTAPSLSDYLAWVSSGHEIAAKDSELSRYMGDIWMRRTIYVAAR